MADEEELEKPSFLRRFKRRNKAEGYDETQASEHETGDEGESSR